MLDFTQLRRTGRPNDWLVAPAGLTPTPPDQLAPLFAADPPTVAAALTRIAAASPRARIVTRSADGLAFTSVSLSRLLGFADQIDGLVLAQGRGATIALYSRARTGWWDFGVNRRRMQLWLHRLAATLPPIDTGSSGGTP